MLGRDSRSFFTRERQFLFDRRTFESLDFALFLSRFELSLQRQQSLLPRCFGALGFDFSHPLQIAQRAHRIAPFLAHRAADFVSVFQALRMLQILRSIHRALRPVPSHVQLSHQLVGQGQVVLQDGLAIAITRRLIVTKRLVVSLQCLVIITRNARQVA